MKKILFFVVLFLTGKMNFSLADPMAKPSKCQRFVSRVFAQYGLPAPGTDEFPHYKDFANLEKYDQEKPEFRIATEPMEILQKQLPGDKSIVRPQYHLMFAGKILEDGSYIFIIGEIEPELTKGYTSFPLYSFLDHPEPVVHDFHFSNSCELQTYQVKQSAHFFYPLDLERPGFSVSANSHCTFDNPPGPGFTAHSSNSDGFVILKYPHYYKELCLLGRGEAQQDHNKGTDSE